MTEMVFWKHESVTIVHSMNQLCRNRVFRFLPYVPVPEREKFHSLYIFPVQGKIN